VAGLDLETLLESEREVSRWSNESVEASDVRSDRQGFDEVRMCVKAALSDRLRSFISFVYCESTNTSSAAARLKVQHMPLSVGNFSKMAEHEI